jgi:hypothetical protein
MALTTYVASFDSHASAAQAVQALEAAGFSHDEVSLLGGEQATNTDEADSGAGIGATVGTMLGGGAGLLAGIGALAIPASAPSLRPAGWWRRSPAPAPAPRPAGCSVGWSGPAFPSPTRICMPRWFAAAARW